MKCMNCGAPVDDLSYYCWDCIHGQKDESSILAPNQDAAHAGEDAKEEKKQDITQKAAPEEQQLTHEQELATALDRLKTRLYLARWGIPRGGVLILGGIAITAYLYLCNIGFLYLAGLGLVIFGAFDFIRSTYRYFRNKKALAEFMNEHAFSLDDMKANLPSDGDKDCL